MAGIMRTLIICQDCEEDPKIWCPMIKDVLWNAIADEKDFLCLECTEKRLGRMLRLNDLKLVKERGMIIAMCRRGWA